jgi:adenosylhomocysteine nucleosidase
LIAFVAAEAREFAGVLRHAERVSRLDWHLDFARKAWLSGQEIVLVANGPGFRLAGQAADTVKEHSEVEGLASIGFCGALDPALKPADIVVATQVHDVAQALSVPRSRSCDGHLGTLLSLDRVATSASEKADLYRKTGASAVEMEAAAVAKRAAGWGVPFYAIKAVTDTAAESFPLDFNVLRDASGRFSRTRILAASLRRPATSFPALLHLNQRCNSAAKAMGDFIADTRF